MKKNGRPKNDPRKYKELADLRDLNYSLSEIAEIYSVNKSTIQRRLKSYYEYLEQKKA